MELDAKILRVASSCQKLSNTKKFCGAQLQGHSVTHINQLFTKLLFANFNGPTVTGGGGIDPLEKGGVNIPPLPSAQV